MKKIISLFLIALTLVTALCSCSQGGGKPEEDKYSKAQMEVIESLSVSLKNKQIVGYKGENDHLIYIFVEYDGEGQKLNETTYYFCFNESVYDFMLPDFEKEPEFTQVKEKIYFTFKSNKAISGRYEKDLEKLKTEFNII